MITPAQCRAARALLEFSQSRLATLAQVSEATVRNFENSRRRTVTHNLKAISSALESAGIEFVGKSGVTVGNSTSAPTSPPTGPIPENETASNSLLVSLLRRVALNQISPNLRYEICDDAIMLTVILGRVLVRSNSEDLSSVEFQPALQSKRDRDDHRLTNFELIRFAEQCYKRHIDH